MVKKLVLTVSLCVTLYSHNNAMNNNNPQLNTTPEGTNNFLEPYHFQTLEEFTKEFMSQKNRSGLINPNFLALAYSYQSQQQTTPLEISLNHTKIEPLKKTLQHEKTIILNRENTVYKEIEQYQMQRQLSPITEQSLQPSAPQEISDSEINEYLNI